MRKILVVAVIATISALSTMLVAERQFSTQLQEQARLAQADPSAALLIESGSDSAQATVDQL